MIDLLRTTIERQVGEAWLDGDALGVAPQSRRAMLVDRLLGALVEIGVDEELVSGDHYVMFDEGGWQIQHALACRPDMLACVINRRLVAEADGPPPEGEGRYRVRILGYGRLEFVAQ